LTQAVKRPDTELTAAFSVETLVAGCSRPPGHGALALKGADAPRGIGIERRPAPRRGGCRRGWFGSGWFTASRFRCETTEGEGVAFWVAALVAADWLAFWGAALVAADWLAFSAAAMVAGCSRPPAHGASALKGADTARAVGIERRRAPQRGGCRRGWSARPSLPGREGCRAWRGWFWFSC
jgi:hypothetical protein